MGEHDEAAAGRLAAAQQKAADLDPAQAAWLDVGIAGVHAILHLADTIRHGIRDVVYELRD